MGSEASVIDPFPPLQKWITEHLTLGDGVRDETYRCGLSALVHRLLKFGYEGTVNHLSARDCLTCCMMSGGLLAEFFLRTAFTRALVENDRLIIDRLLAAPFIPESRLWLAKLMAAAQGDAKALEDGAIWLETMHGEERALASLLIGRIFPQFVEVGWLFDCPTDYPRLAAEMALLVLRDPQKTSVVKEYLRTHPRVRFSIDDEHWPL